MKRLKFDEDHPVSSEEVQSYSDGRKHLITNNPFKFMKFVNYWVWSLLQEQLKFLEFAELRKK
jgi:hypothetical protein